MTTKKPTEFHIYRATGPIGFGTRTVLIMATSLKNAVTTVPWAESVERIKEHKILINKDVFRMLKKMKEEKV